MIADRYSVFADTAADKTNAAVANKAYQMAIAGDPPAARFFWLKCRAGWKEKHGIEHSGPDGESLRIKVTGIQPTAENSE